jgi:type IV pilus assembly protein PilN
MIKINLLPFRAARKKENVRRQVSVYFLSIIFVAAIAGLVSLDVYSKLTELEEQKTERTKELAKYAGTNKKIEKIKQKITTIRTKLEVIRGLEKNKTGPVLLLDEISAAVPKEKLWLRSFKEKDGLLELEGSAMDNDTVALFMTNLEKAEQIQAVDLKTTKLRAIPEYKLNVTDFILTCETYSHKPEPKPEPAKEKRPRKKRKR